MSPPTKTWNLPSKFLWVEHMYLTNFKVSKNISVTLFKMDNWSNSSNKDNIRVISAVCLVRKEVERRTGELQTAKKKVKEFDRTAQVHKQSQGLLGGGVLSEGNWWRGKPFPKPNVERWKGGKERIRDWQGIIDWQWDSHCHWIEKTNFKIAVVPSKRKWHDALTWLKSKTLNWTLGNEVSGVEQLSRVSSLFCKLRHKAQLARQRRCHESKLIGGIRILLLGQISGHCHSAAFAMPRPKLENRHATRRLWWKLKIPKLIEKEKFSNS